MKKVLFSLLTGLLLFSMQASFALEEPAIFFDLEMLSSYETIILVIDPLTGEILFVSEGAKSFYQYPDLIKKNIDEINQLTEQEIQKEMEAARKEDRNFFIFQHLLGSGQVKDVYVYSYPMMMNNHPVLVSMVLDMTDELSRASQIKRLYWLLLFFLAIISVFAFFLVYYYAKNKKNIEKASKEKSYFLAHVSHELRTPLNGVIGFTDLLSTTELCIQQSHYVHQIQSCSKSLVKILNDILDLSKVEAGKLELDYEEHWIVQTIEEALDVVSYKVSKKRIKLYFEMDPSAYFMAYYDDTRLKQVLVNLLNNAIKFTEEGHVELRVYYKPIDEKKGVFSFQINDTGPGIEKSKQKHIFDAFTQGSHRTYKKHGGVGLGLLISKKILMEMNSDLHFNSHEGEGTSFFFDLVLDLSSSFEPFLNNKRIQSIGIYDEDLRTSESLKTFFEYLGSEVLVHTSLKSDLKPDIFQMHQYSFFTDSFFKKNESVILSHGLLDRVIVMYQLNEMNEMKNTEKKYPELKIITFPIKPREILAIFTDPTRDFSKDKNSRAKEDIVSHEKTNILIADDVELNLELLEIYLKKCLPEAEIVKANHGGEAMKLIKANLYDLYILDIQMPEYNGFEIAKEVRLQTTAPIIALSGENAKYDSNHFESKFMNSYLQKPIQMKALKAVLSHYL